MALYLPSDDNLFFDNDDGFSQPVIFSPGTANQVVTSAILEQEPFTFIDQNGVIINEQIPILIIKTSNIPSYCSTLVRIVLISASIHIESADTLFRDHKMLSHSSKRIVAHPSSLPLSKILHALRSD